MEGTGTGARHRSRGATLFDFPVVYYQQSQSKPLSSSPGGIAGVTAAIYCALLMAAVLVLDRVLVAAAAAGLATVLVVLLQQQALISGGAQIITAVVMGTAAAAGAFAIGRIGALIRSVSTEEMKRQRLGRYFSPDVASRLQDLGTLGGVCRVARGHRSLFSDIRDFTAMSEERCAPKRSSRC